MINFENFPKREEPSSEQPPYSLKNFRSWISFYIEKIYFFLKKFKLPLFDEEIFDQQKLEKILLILNFAWNKIHSLVLSINSLQIKIKELENQKDASQFELELIYFKTKLTILNFTLSFLKLVFLESLKLLIFYLRKFFLKIFDVLVLIDIESLIEGKNEIIKTYHQNGVDFWSKIDVYLRTYFGKRGKTQNLTIVMPEIFKFLKKILDDFNSEEGKQILAYYGLEIPERFATILKEIEDLVKELFQEIEALIELIDLALLKHENFNKESKIPYSFHNQFHIKATLIAADRLIQAAINKEDPLNISADLERWNKENKIEPPISLEEFRYIALIAFACHDLGNIAKPQNNDVVFLERYTSQGAEERSKLIALSLIKKSSLLPSTKERWLPLILYLISQTTFNPEDPSLPFATFTRVVDQIGGNLFNPNRELAVLGLIYEIVNEGRGEENFNPYRFYNFPYLRFPELVPEENIRKRILNIWGKNIKLENHLQFPDQEITFEGFLRFLDEK